jgi:hypothetical protein
MTYWGEHDELSIDWGLTLNDLDEAAAQGTYLSTQQCLEALANATLQPVAAPVVAQTTAAPVVAQTTAAPVVAQPRLRRSGAFVPLKSFSDTPVTPTHSEASCLFKLSYIQ